MLTSRNNNLQLAQISYNMIVPKRKLKLFSKKQMLFCLYNYLTNYVYLIYGQIKPSALPDLDHIVSQLTMSQLLLYLTNDIILPNEFSVT